ncbi:MAG: radical SAM family heme chaperone HemW [Verrucomicrobiota bacterium]
MNENAGKNQIGRKLGLYTHVPFCSTICDFCAFYQVQGDRKSVLSYLEGIERELELIDCDRRIDTFFWGGGTPSLLKAEDMDRLCRILVERFGVPLEEWTVEMAPSSVRSDKLEVLKNWGVTRVSMGAQSFDERLLDALGRQHNLKQIYRAYDLIREAEFRSVNLDLMFALPGQTNDELLSDFRAAIALEPDHISTYCLTFEEDTALFVKLSQGKVSIDEEKDRSYYELAWKTMADAGYDQYEVSNYAKPGHRCAHNVNTWRMNEWIGLGPSAAEQYAGKRESNLPDLKKWREALEIGKRGGVDMTEITAGLVLEDALIFGLRMNSGVDLSDLSNRFGGACVDDLRGKLESLVRVGHAENAGKRYFLTDEGRMVVDAIGAELIGFAEIG